MPLLSAEQQARLDATITEKVEAEGLPVGRLGSGRRAQHKSKRLPKSGTTWGSVMDSAAPPIYAAGRDDPNWSDGEVSLEAPSLRVVFMAVSASPACDAEHAPQEKTALRGPATPRTDAVVHYKRGVSTLLDEYFASASITEALQALADLDIPAYAPYFLKKVASAPSAQRPP